MTPFQIISDLHLETGVVYPVKSITPHSEVLVLAGDIGSFYNLDPLVDFLEKISSKFKHVLYIPGNHEYYYSLDKRRQTTGALLYKFKKAVSHIGRLHVMDRHLVNINGTIFAGATLWSDPYPHKRLPDFMNLDKSLHEYADMHKRDIKWLNRVADLNIGEAPLVVITHHAPSKTLVKKSASIGANATIVCGITIGEYALIGSGTVVTKDVPDFSLVIGNPGKIIGWINKKGHKLDFDTNGISQCGEYKLKDNKVYLL